MLEKLASLAIFFYCTWAEGLTLFKDWCGFLLISLLIPGLYHDDMILKHVVGDHCLATGYSVDHSVSIKDIKVMATEQ